MMEFPVKRRHEHTEYKVMWAKYTKKTPDVCTNNISNFLQHEFITQAKPCTILHKMIQEAKEIHEAQSQANQNEDDSVSTVLHPTEEKLNRN